ncbi:1276_t:CDS:2, partial [Diversispora eburnea]
EKVRKILKKETAVVLVKTEVFNDNRIISALYDNEEEMEKGKQCDVGGNAGKPTYMHRAEIFRKNPVKELMHDVKLWDVPLGMKNKELKENLENKYADNLKSREEHATRIIGLPNGITARELWPHVEKIGARTCYIPRTRTYRRKNEAI